MIKRRLPHNWITVSSKTHPDRVYYFNVRTKQSSWTEPVLDKAEKMCEINDKSYRKRHEEKDQTIITPERNPVDDRTFCKQQSSIKITETPQMKAIREKILKKLTAKDKSSLPSSSKTLTKLTENKTVSSLKRTSKLVKNDESLSLDKNDNEVTTFTPQMSALYEKIQRRNLNKSNPDKKIKNEC